MLEATRGFASAPSKADCNDDFTTPTIYRFDTTNGLANASFDGSLVITDPQGVADGLSSMSLT